ncbi:hypothetical protein JCM15457_502 [Liquorilactobacillus sucicola DSM 21376 = JCM 15457]|uniref:Uncharacterized protein n=1 Tax=Liquorilactobacillus sucicola DSM 21376 = JCM 15457 TaxID=1423806 RepID=A0A023CUT4_9LACO|nr:hypothetical protein FD15_GL002108 [Liquorilactobacillus sucicola DSM 21376 = JCM 15457]GAJ25627.1 hypothetical protein JCM15457_502 [Liquorilactobacillus sucicola DSM 21376 = JCM 15457]
MMGKYLLYYKKKIVGEVYDDRLLVKPIKAAVEYMPHAEYKLRLNIIAYRGSGQTRLQHLAFKNMLINIFIIKY